MYPLIQEQPLRHIGKSYVMTEAHQVVTGRAVYSSDIQLVGMLFGKILRSPYPHAKILSIDTSKAEKLDGVKAVISAQDIPDVKFGTTLVKGFVDRSVLARDKVRFTGEPIAAVVAENQDIAEKALELIDVKYDILQPVFDAEEAMEDSSVILHSESVNNLSNSFFVKKGDVSSGFEDSDLVIENRFSTGLAQHCPMESHAIVARPEADGGVTIWTGACIPHMVVERVSSTLQIPLRKVRVLVPLVGGHYGAKNATELEPICAALALKTSCPVKFLLSRKEEFHMYTRHPFVVYIKDGFRRDGSLLARKLKIILNGGAYSAGGGGSVPKSCVFATTAVYDIPNMEVESLRAYTNHPPSGPFRGFGIPQVLWAIEQHMDMAASKLGIDPVELRRRNLLEDGEINVLGERVRSLPIKECLDKVADAIKMGEPSRTVGDWRIAKGIGVGVKHSQAKNISNASVKLFSDGSLEAIVTTVEVGQGIRTIIAQIAAEELQIPMDKVSVSYGDTSFTPFDGGSISSRSAFNTGNAVRLACQDLKHRMLNAASKKLQAKPEDMETRDGEIFLRDRSRSISVGDLFTFEFAGEDGEFVGNGTWRVQGSKMDAKTSQPVDLLPGDENVRVVAFYTPIAQAAEVAVNVRTGEVRVLKVVQAADVGKAINKDIVVGQLSGAATMALAVTMFEEMNFEEGRLLNTGFLDYKLPTVLDLTENLQTIVIESNLKEGPYGAKGVGEVGMVAIGAAVGNAIYNATGIRLTDAPITMKKMIDAMTAAKRGAKPHV